MCTVLLAWRCVPGAPVVLAANRDEFFGRPTTEPEVLLEHPRIAGGRDLLSGGTWLAVDSGGRLVTVTNRLTERIDPTRRSRGDLPVQLLTSGDWSSPAALVSSLDPARYNPFNILCVSPELAVVGHGLGQGPLQVVELDPGLHVLTLCDVDQADDAKVAFLSGFLAERSQGCDDAAALLAAMEEVLAEHGDDDRGDLDATCVHGDGYGTVSSSSVMVAADGIVYRHAPGPPCTADYRDVSGLLGEQPAASSRR